MKSKNLLIGLVCLLIVVVVLSMSTKSQKPEEQPKFETIVIGTGGEPKWSPDGTRLAFMSGGWLCVAKADGKGEIQRIAQLQPWTFDWMSDSAFVVSDKIPWNPPGKGRGHKFIIETVDLKGQVRIIREDSLAPGDESERQYVSYIGAPVILRDGTVGYYEIQEKPGGETKIFKTIKQGNLIPEQTLKQMDAFVDPYPWGNIWLQEMDGKCKKRLTIGETDYSFPKLSPDGTKILAVLASYTSDLVILDTSGVELVRLGVGFTEISPGVFAGGASSRAQWSPDSKKIVYTWLVESERHPEAVTSDLYIINADGTVKTQITDTPEQAEHDPVWSPDGSKIACHSDNTQKIFVIKIK
jgi:Tol biopolymer transport system component